MDNTTELGKDSIKGGVFFGSNLTPSGTFENIPQVVSDFQLSTPNEPKLTATLALIKEELQNNAKLKNQSSQDVLSDSSINKFLQEYVQLLIDYRDLRNVVFFGSSYVEMKHQIDWMKENYPFKSFVAELLPNNLEILYYSNNTEIIFNNTNVLQSGNYHFDVEGETIWPDFEVLDKNNNRYPILHFSNAIFAEIFNVSGTNPYTIEFKRDIEGTDYGIQTLTNGVKFYVVDINNNIKGIGEISNIIQFANYTSVDINIDFESGYTTVDIGDYIVLPPTIYSLLIKGTYSISNFIEWVKDNELYKGIVITPKLKTLIDFEVSLDGLKKILIDPLNPTPWPREPITNNIIIEGESYTSWLEDPNNLILNYNADKDGYVSDENLELNLVSALTLDEEQTNQLLVRAIPHRLVSELNDMDDRYFTRFVWLAGKMFDTVKVYIDFLKYTHTLNFTPYNQLSPEFHDLFAQHYGFNLLDEDNINFSQTLIFTEPGLAYDLQSNAVYNNELASQTVKELIYERQKRLLIHLIYLYQKKGTIQCIEYLTNLLGSPKGLVLLEELAIDKTTNNRIADNVKIHIPTYNFVVDEDYTTNPLYPVYKIQLDNDNIENLREIDINLDILGAILNDILKYGQTISPYGLLKEKTFANLYNPNESFYLLPLNFPDKFSGITFNYNIPRNGLKYGWCNNEGEVSYNLPSIYKIENINYGLIINQIITSDAIGVGLTDVYIDIVPSFTPSSITIQNAGEIIPDGVYNVLSIETISNQLIIRIDFNSVAAIYLENGIVINNKPLSLNPSNQYNYRIPPIFLDDLDNSNSLLKDELITYNSYGTFIIPSNLDLVTRDGEVVELVIINDVGDRIIIGNSIWDNSLSLEENIIKLKDSVSKTVSIPNFQAYFNKTQLGYLFTVIYDITSTISNEPLSLVVETGGYTDVEITPIALQLTNYIPSQETTDYIIARLEGKDLVVRLKLVDETTLITIERVALFENVFTNDGLNHFLKLIYRLEGVEVYHDYKYLGLARWKEMPLIIPPLWTARQLPKQIIEFLDIVPLPSTIAIHPDVLPSWWDLFIGWPKGIEMYANRVSVFEAKYISQPDLSTSQSLNHEKESWVFDFSNQKKSNNGVYYENLLNIESTYKSGVPLEEWTDPNLPVDLAAFFSTNYDKVNLISKNLYNSEVKFLQSVADFFILPPSELYNIENLFKYNAWSTTLHKDYTYENFDKVYDNYYTFAQQVLTFINLNSFVELIENKFQPLVRQFIPIVINLNNFGKLLRNNIAKIRYPFAHYNCFGYYNESKAKAGFKINNGLFGAPSFNFGLFYYLNDILSIEESVSPITIKTVSDHCLTNGIQVEIYNVIGCINANGTHTITVIDDKTFSLDGSTWDASWLGGGELQYKVWETANFDWEFSNIYTADNIRDYINTNFSPTIIAESIDNVVNLYFDVLDFWNIYNKNINELKLEFNNTSPIEIGEIFNPAGGQIQTSGNECIVISYEVKGYNEPSLNNWGFFIDESAPEMYNYFIDESIDEVYTYFLDES